MNKIRNYVTLGFMFDDNFSLVNVQSIVSDYCASATTLDAKFEQVLDVLYDGYYDWFIGFKDKFFNPSDPESCTVLTNDDYLEIGVKFIRKLSVIYNLTESKYLYLLNLYGAQKANLMNQLSVVQSTLGDHRVNDTPQNGGVFTNDEHTSVYEANSSTVTTSSDPMTIMARIDEIQNKYMNVLKAWCNEFSSLFIPPYNELEVEDDSDGE